jgi:hypothetical protein
MNYNTEYGLSYLTLYRRLLGSVWILVSSYSVQRSATYNQIFGFYSTVKSNKVSRNQSGELTIKKIDVHPMNLG